MQGILKTKKGARVHERRGLRAWKGRELGKPVHGVSVMGVDIYMYVCVYTYAVDALETKCPVDSNRRGQKTSQLRSLESQLLLHQSMPAMLQHLS